MTTKITTSITKADQGLSLVGDVVFSNVSDLLDQGDTIIQEHIQSEKNDVLTINCQAMNRIDSAGIALLLEWQRRCLDVKSKCVFVELSEQAQVLIQTYRLQTIIT